jgi:hypothetical protein
MKNRCLALAIAGATSVVGGCRSNDGSGRVGSVVDVTVFGPPRVWAKVARVEVGLKDADLPETSAAAAEDVPLTAHAFVCSADRQHFLEAALTVRVHLVDGSVVTSEVERYACRYSAAPGPVELVTVEVREDGSISAEFGDDPQGPWTSCAAPNSGWVCPVDEF